MKMYSIYDKVAKAFNTPFYAQTNGIAVRMFSESVNDSRSSVYRAPHDYICQLVGEFNESTGEIIPVVPETVIHGQECVDENSQRPVENKMIDELQRLILKVEQLSITTGEQ